MYSHQEKNIYFDFSDYKYWQNWDISVSETEHFDFNKIDNFGIIIITVNIFNSFLLI